MNQQQELDHIGIENFKLRKELDNYIEHKNELIHITMSPDKWKLFCKWLETQRKHE